MGLGEKRMVVERVCVLGYCRAIAIAVFLFPCISHLLLFTKPKGRDRVSDQASFCLTTVRCSWL